MATYYVSSGLGNDSNNGLSASTPFATLQNAANRTQPGDSVEVMNGTYTNPGGYDVLDINTSGTPSAPITYEALSGQHPVIDSTGSRAGITDQGASYITINGFEIKGDADSITADYALANPSSYLVNGAGINVWGTNPTHVTIENNSVHHEGAGGIGVFYGDYISLLNNTVYDNAWWDNAGGSGISVGWMKDSDSNTSTAKVNISGNVLYGNEERVPNTNNGGGAITDGNAIILDTNSSYNGRMLVANNLAYSNGGAGLALWQTSNVSALYNTFYNNETNVGVGHQNGQVWQGYGTNVVVENNIIDAPNNEPLSGSWGGAAVFDYNTQWGTSPQVAHGAHDVNADPLFVSAGSNFALQSTSPAIDKANLAYTVPADIVGNHRPSGVGYDIGAYEYQSAPPPPPPVDDTLVLNLSGDMWRGAPEFTAAIDGKSLGPAQAVTALHSSGQSQAFTFKGMFGAGTHDLAVSFINDAYGGSWNKDRNLYVNSVDYDGTHYASAMAVLGQNGTVHFMIGSH